MKVFVEGVGLLAPGLESWTSGHSVLAGKAIYAATPLSVPAPELLPAVERRRTGLPVKLALVAGLEALRNGGRAPAGVATVFTSSGGDGEVIHEICSTLAGPDRQVSPTRFHNSVHNAPAGYWGIATQSRRPSTSLCGFEWSFAVGLLDAATQSVVEHEEVLIIAYDAPYPEPLRRVHPVTLPFAAALLLGPDGSDRSLACLELSLTAGQEAAAPMRDPGLERLRADNAGARALPLLATLAAGSSGKVRLATVAGNTLDIAVRPR